jgi:hypothetical protein
LFQKYKPVDRTVGISFLIEMEDNGRGLNSALTARGTFCLRLKDAWNLMWITRKESEVPDMDILLTSSKPFEDEYATQMQKNP